MLSRPTFQFARVVALLLSLGLLASVDVGGVGPAGAPPVEPGASEMSVPTVRARAAIIYNPVTREVLWEENSREQLPIASITKVMTAVIFMEHHPDLTREVVISRDDVRRASVTYLRPRERISVDNLLHLSLIASDNGAARTLARISPWGSAGFIDRMNEKAMELGLDSTSFADPSGLDADNVSSAYDLSRLITYAAGSGRIGQIMRKASYRIRTNRRRVRIRNTNELIGGDVDVRGGKTGYIRRAGFCLATLLQLPQLPQSDPVALVILGARSNGGRFREARRLISWLATEAQSLINRARPSADSRQSSVTSPQSSARF